MHRKWTARQVAEQSVGALTRRRILKMGGASLVGALTPALSAAVHVPAIQELVLRIAPAEIEVAPNRVVRTVAYDVGGDGIVRIPEGRPVAVEIHNGSSREEFVHWHGFHLDARLDGTAEEGSLSVRPGASLRYTLPPQQAGSYFVHSHAMAHHDMGAGTYSGQFAFVHVQPRQEEVAYDREVFLSTHEWEPYMINEADEERGEEEMHHLRIDLEEAEEIGEGGWDMRYRLASINGRALGHGEPIRVREGERVMFRILNASATENIRLALPGHVFRVMAMDGRAVPRPATVPVLQLGIGERVDALVEMRAPGVWVMGSTDDEMRGKGLGIVVEYAGRSGEPLWVDVQVAEWDYGLFALDAQPRDAEEIVVTMQRLPLSDNGAERWAMDASGKADVNLRPGRPRRLRLRNESNEWHPMHLHRHTFELVRYRGRECSGLSKDTVVVPPYDEIEMLLVPRQSGPALFHCHNQMHMDAGLQMMLHVA